MSSRCLAYSPDPGPVAVVNQAETAIVSRVPVRAFINPANRLMVYRGDLGQRWAGPAFLLNQMLVWGFTGQVISAVLDVAGWAEPWDTDDLRELDEAMELVGDQGDAAMSSMTPSQWLDVAVLAVAFIAAISGWRSGALGSLLSFVGVLLGAIAGVLLAPHIVSHIAAPRAKLFTALFLILALVVVGEVAGVVLGRAVRGAIRSRTSPIGRLGHRRGGPAARGADRGVVAGDAADPVEGSAGAGLRGSGFAGACSGQRASRRPC